MIVISIGALLLRQNKSFTTVCVLFVSTKLLGYGLRLMVRASVDADCQERDLDDDDPNHDVSKVSGYDSTHRKRRYELHGACDRRNRRERRRQARTLKHTQSRSETTLTMSHRY